MDISPIPEESSPKYPKQKRISPDDIVVSVMEAGVIAPPWQEKPSFSKTDYRIARRIIKHGMEELTTQLMGGTPIEIGSDVEKAQQRRNRQYERVYEKLMLLLEWLEQQ